MLALAGCLVVLAVAVAGGRMVHPRTHIVSYFEFELKPSGTRIPLSLASSSNTIHARLSSHDSSLMHWLDWCKCGLFPESTEQ